MEALDFKDLSPFYKRIDIIEKTAAQVQKDFGAFDYPISFSGDIETAYEELFTQVLAHISYMWEKQQNTLWNILYQIDLDENKVLSTFHHSEKPIDSLTQMILERELKKVVFRAYFSK
jgi:hypothetical protein